MTPQETIGAVAATLAGLTVIGTALRFVYRFIKKVESALGTDRNGRSISDRLGFVETALADDSQGRSISERLDKVEHQVFPNSGGSLSDQVRNVDKALTEVKAEVGIVRGLLTTLVDNHGAQGPQATPKPKTARAPRGRSRQPE